MTTEHDRHMERLIKEPTSTGDTTHYLPAAVALGDRRGLAWVNARGIRLGGDTVERAWSESTASIIRLLETKPDWVEITEQQAIELDGDVEVRVVYNGGRESKGPRSQSTVGFSPYATHYVAYDDVPADDGLLDEAKAIYRALGYSAAWFQLHPETQERYIDAAKALREIKS